MKRQFLACTTALSLCASVQIASADSWIGGIGGDVRLSFGSNHDSEIDVSLLESSVMIPIFGNLFVQGDLRSEQYNGSSDASSNSYALHLGYNITDQIAVGIFGGRENWSYGSSDYTYEYHGVEAAFGFGPLSGEVYGLRYDLNEGGEESDRYGLDLAYAIDPISSSWFPLIVIGGIHSGSGYYEDPYRYLGIALPFDSGFTFDARVGRVEDESQFSIGLSYDFGGGASFNRRGWTDWQGIYP
jgi:hypothetical protein